MTFDQLGLSAPLLEAVAAQKYTQPTPIQAQAIPAVLSGRDVMAAAQTGTGKTAGFTLPLLEILSRGRRAGRQQARALVLTPTRELAAQVADSVATYGKGTPLSSAVVFGGVKINPQIARLQDGVDILIATPGRLLDLHNQGAVKFDHLEVLILDEADRMLDMGFIHDIRRIIKLLPEVRQNLMFSATFSREIRQLAKTIVNQPEEISVTPRNATAKTVRQWMHPVDKKRKPELLAHLFEEHNWQQVLVFSRTKHGANRLTRFLEARGIEAAAIHGNKSQGARTKALADFKKGKLRALVATDIAARGIDIDQLPQVVNIDLPNVSEDYVHRIGRTGRAGSTGSAVSLVSADEVGMLSGIEHLTQQLVERVVVDGFEPEHDVPATDLKHKVRGPKQESGQKNNGRGRKPARQGGRSGGESADNAQGRRRRPRKSTSNGNRRPAPNLSGR
ncbi:MAG: DEAD/DEAH box helicase [Pseudomonadota bacterium]